MGFCRRSPIFNLYFFLQNSIYGSDIVTSFQQNEKNCIEFYRNGQSYGNLIRNLWFGSPYFCHLFCCSFLWMWILFSCHYRRKIRFIYVNWWITDLRWWLVCEIYKFILLGCNNHDHNRLWRYFPCKLSWKIILHRNDTF